MRVRNQKATINNKVRAIERNFVLGSGLWFLLLQRFYVIRKPKSCKRKPNDHLSLIRQKDESQNGCFKKAKHAKISEKQTFLTP